MSNALFLHPYLSDLATVTASSTASGLTPANVQTADPSLKWQSTSGSGSSLDFDFGAGGFAATALALISVNLSAAATWFIGASNASIANARTGGGMIAANNTSPWVGGKTAKPDWAHHICLARWANATPFRFWSVVFTDASLTFIEVGRAMVGIPWQPSTNLDQNVGRGWLSADPQERTPHNKLMVDRRGPTARQFDLMCSSADQDEVEDGAGELARLRGNGGDFLFCLDPDHTTRFAQWSMQCVFASGVRTDGVPFFKNGKQCWAFRASLLELV